LKEAEGSHKGSNSSVPSVHKYAVIQSALSSGFASYSLGC